MAEVFNANSNGTHHEQHHTHIHKKTESISDIFTPDVAVFKVEINITFTITTPPPPPPRIQSAVGPHETYVTYVEPGCVCVFFHHTHTTDDGTSACACLRLC